jgi:hypothetical protein
MPQPNEKTLEGQALVILGSPRSGTSVTVNAFRLLGFYLGDDEDFPDPKEGNPAGIYERKEFLRFNNLSLDSLYLGHERPEMEAMQDHPAFERLVDEAIKTMTSVFGGNERWGWKGQKGRVSSCSRTAATTFGCR